jgi:hypothetical protein
MEGKKVCTISIMKKAIINETILKRIVSDMN